MGRSRKPGDPPVDIFGTMFPNTTGGRRGSPSARGSVSAPRGPVVNTSSNQSGRGYSSAGAPSAQKQASDAYWANEQKKYEKMGAAHSYAQAAAEQLGDAPVDPYNGMTWADMLTMMNNGGSNGSGSRGRGGGGGGGRSGPSATDLSAAYNAYLGSMDGLTNQQLSAYDEAQRRLGGVYDARGADADRRRAEAEARRRAIMAELTAGAGTSRTAVQGAYQGGDDRLAALATQYGQQAQGRVGGMNRTLQAFGGAPDVSAETGVQDTIMAQRAALAGQAGTADALYANRGNVYNGLNADAQTVDQNQYQQIVNQIAQARMEQAAKAEMERLGIIQSGQRSAAELRLQAAREGVTL